MRKTFMGLSYPETPFEWFVLIAAGISLLCAAVVIIGYTFNLLNL